MRQKRLLHYAIALLSVLVAWGVRTAFNPVLGDDFPFFSFYVAMGYCAWFMGPGEAVISGLAGALTSTYFFMAPHNQLTPLQTRHWIGLGTFGLVTLAFTGFSYLKERSSQQVERSSRELELAEGALQSSEAKFRAVAETASSAIYIHDGEQLLFVNRAAELMTGYSRDQLTKMDMWKLVHPDDRELVRERAEARMRAQAVPQRYEYRIIARNGEVRWLDFSANIVHFDGKACVLATAFDITERKRAEEALQHQSRLNQTITENATACLFMIDHHGRCTFLNPAAEKTTGYSAAELLGQTLHDLIHYKHADGSPYPLWECPIDRALPQMTPLRDYEDVFVRKDGSIFPVLLSASPIMEDGQPVATVIEARDISATKLAEDALRKSEKLAAAGRLAATIAHEINNPLEAITNLLYLTRSSVEDPEQSRVYLEMAEQELQRVSHISRQTLGFYRDTSHPVPVSIAETFEDVLQLLGRKAIEGRVQLERRYEITEPVVLLKGEIRQVLSNLVSNAIDASPSGGRLILHVYQGKGWQGRERDGIFITVADTGTGIPPDHRDRLFEPFFTTKRDIGTGLGLWVSKGIVEKHGGYIRMRSRTDEKHGTVFRVFIPFAQVERQRRDSQVKAGESERQVRSA